MQKKNPWQLKIDFWNSFRFPNRGRLNKACWVKYSVHHSALRNMILSRSSVFTEKARGALSKDDIEEMGRKSSMIKIAAKVFTKLYGISIFRSESSWSFLTQSSTVCERLPERTGIRCQALQGVNNAAFQGRLCVRLLYEDDWKHRFLHESVFLNIFLPEKFLQISNI